MERLKNDQTLLTQCGVKLPSKPAMSRWENALTLSDVARLAERRIDHFVVNLDPDRNETIIGMACPSDPTHGS